MKATKFLLFSFVSISCFINNNLFAQQSVSLKNCIELALEKNYDIKIIKNQQIIAVNNYSRGNAGMLPTVDLLSQYSGNLDNTNQTAFNGVKTINNGIHNTISNAGLQAGWSVFNGFKAHIRYMQLGELKEIAELKTRISIENVIADLSSEYYFYVQQRRLFKNLQYSVDLSRERVRIEQEHFLLGSGSKVRLLQAQVNLNSDSSRLERQYEVLNASQIRLSELMAINDSANGFIPEDTLIIVNPGLIYDNLLADVNNNNAAILLALKNKVISEQEMRIVRSRVYPYLNLSSGYGFTYNTYQSGTVRNYQTIGMNYGISLGINIFDGRNRSRERRNALIEIENSELEYERIKQENMADLLTLFNAYSNNLRLLGLETQNLAVASENLEIAFEKYRLGALSGFELREVQKDLLEAEERLLSVQFQAKIAEISLLQISGHLIE
ncbi:MAG: TolC family protein [Bacteroidales bacterium]|nr:TolC family protein [Bacteroidales bacterium]